jgi:hypothetical protein
MAARGRGAGDAKCVALAASRTPISLQASYLRCMPPNIGDTAPDQPFLTGYDEQQLVLYLRLLDADAKGADWREIVKVVLQIDANIEPPAR